MPVDDEKSHVYTHAPLHARQSHVCTHLYTQSHVYTHGKPARHSPSVVNKSNVLLHAACTYAF